MLTRTIVERTDGWYRGRDINVHTLIVRADVSVIIRQSKPIAGLNAVGNIVFFIVKYQAGNLVLSHIDTVVERCRCTIGVVCGRQAQVDPNSEERAFVQAVAALTALPSQGKFGGVLWISCQVEIIEYCRFV